MLVRAALADGKIAQFDAFTTSVNANGGLLESTVRMTVGQQITLVNPLTRREIGCRVVRVDGASDKLFAIAFEFDERSPQFWPIPFPPGDWGLVDEIASEQN